MILCALKQAAQPLM